MAKRQGKAGQGSKKPNRTPAHIIYARINPDLGAAFEAYIADTKPKPSNTSALELALEEFLKSRGYWPPKQPQP